MIKISTVFLLLFSLNLFAQGVDSRIVKAERERFHNQQQLSKVMYPGDSEIDVTYYGLNLTITTGPNFLTGAVTVNAKVDTASLNSFFLDLRSIFTVDSVTLNGSTTSFTHLNQKITIPLEHTYTQGEEFSTTIYYQGVPGSSGFGGFLFGSHGGSPVISTLSESYSGPYWWPQKDTPADKADSSDVWITVANTLTPVANGLLEEVIDNGNGTHTYYWKERYPIAAYLISLAISNYTQYDTYYKYSPTDSMIITHFFYPDHFASYKQYADATAGMIAVFSQRYGQYPFIQERYGHAEFTWGGSMEHQTCTSMGFWGTGVVSHELAHQWYGDMITCKDWHHIWLNEGFATYSEAVYLEAINGQAAYNSAIQSEMNNAKNAQGSIWVQDISNENQIFNGARSYSKGACVLHMLRGVVGDSTFFDVMRAYSNDPDLKFNSATTEDFQGVAESVSGMDLNYFFQEWIYGENYPDYNVGWNAQSIGGGQYQVSLNINQLTNSNPTFFTMPIKVKFNYSGGDTTVTVFNDQQSQNFQIVLNNNPLSIVFDSGNWILKHLGTVTNAENGSQPSVFSLEQNYPNPFNPSTIIKFSIPQKENVSLKIYNILGKEVAVLINNDLMGEGKHQVEFDASGLNSGVYFYTIEAGNYRETKKMILMK